MGTYIGLNALSIAGAVGPEYAAHAAVLDFQVLIPFVTVHASLLPALGLATTTN